MTSVDQQCFIENLKKALAGHGTASGTVSHASIDSPAAALEKNTKTIVHRSREDRLALLEKVIEESRPLNLQVMACKDLASVAMNIKRLVDEKEPEWGDQKQVAAWKHPLVMELNLPEVLHDTAVPVRFMEMQRPDDKQALRQWIFESYIGVTSAEYCLADSATLVLKTRKGQARSVSLVPSIHIAVIRLDQILADLKELYYILKNDPEQIKEGLTTCMTFITGPSKTADIEATMVHGAHGPREVYLFVVTG